MIETPNETALAKVAIGALDYLVDGNILSPYYRCYVITTAGQIWDVNCAAFTCTQGRLRDLWVNSFASFTKREITTPLY